MQGHVNGPLPGNAERHYEFYEQHLEFDVELYQCVIPSQQLFGPVSSSLLIIALPALRPSVQPR